MNHVRQASLQPRIWATGFKELWFNKRQQIRFVFFFSEEVFPTCWQSFFYNSSTLGLKRIQITSEYCNILGLSLTVKGSKDGFCSFFLGGGSYQSSLSTASVLGVHEMLFHTIMYIYTCMYNICIYIYIYASLIYVHLYRYMYTLCAFYSWLFSIHSDAKVVPESLVL